MTQKLYAVVWLCVVQAVAEHLQQGMQDAPGSVSEHSW